MPEEYRKKEARRLLTEMTQLYEDVKEKGDQYYSVFAKEVSRASFKESAHNLSYYLALRNYDLRKLQAELVPLGISSLGRLENKTIGTLQSVIHSLASISETETEFPRPDLNAFTRGDHQLDRNVFTILGEKTQGRNTLIMVTMPSEAANDRQLVKNLIDSGMNIARINCAHDNPEIWSQIIQNIKSVAADQAKDIRILMDIAGPKIRTEWIFTQYKNPKVQKNDEILLTGNFDRLPLNFPGKVVIGSDIQPIYQALSIGDPVLIDDGSVECEVIEIEENQALLKVTKAKGSGVRLKAEKGLNFPQTHFDIDIISDKDHEDIAFACEHADVVGCSFVRTPKDIQDIQKRIDEVLGEYAEDMPILAKIETVQAVENLAEIIYAAAGRNPFAIMIARGDLAVETGYIRLAELQQEIMWIAEAADVPVVWGTEVLANLVKSGIPTRAEVTDAAEGARADCVMLNKGNYIVEAVKMLNQIFKRMRQHQYKKTPKLRALNIADLSTETDQ
ncbi:hypothetical protein HZY91_00895 [Facklamia sp. DSM 111018]|uniref:Pyruvate kinase n=1 Tax=Facklamia lactis TaxID=2749967 RepID=A0ABS0LMU6_9LACT|nr:pyruvate kinase [Facklamia lactis]MBG9979873.1 hypothetical protein [Facklamia lactis]MBG9985447.1 hypothetical protein [Facklamia lactis]